jgi:hypothetical protein
MHFVCSCDYTYIIIIVIIIIIGMSLYWPSLEDSARLVCSAVN